MTFVHAFTAYKAQFGTTDAKGALILNRDSYAAMPFKTLRGFTVTNKSLLLPTTRSVYVRHTNAIPRCVRPMAFS